MMSFGFLIAEMNQKECENDVEELGSDGDI
jgi:hypothetical protein